MLNILIFTSKYNTLIHHRWLEVVTLRRKNRLELINLIDEVMSETEGTSHDTYFGIIPDQSDRRL